MARFTKIPETNLAGALGGIVGQAAGTVIGTGNIAIDKLQAKVDNLCQIGSEKREPTKEDLDKFEKELDKIEATLDTLDKTISAVETTLEGLNTVVTTVSIPIAALKVAINIIEYLPLPQIWLVTSVSALQASLVQMLSELVAQIEQIVLTLLIIIKILLALLKKLKDLIANLRKIVAALRAWLTLQRSMLGSGDLSNQDKETLVDIGVLNEDGTNIFGDLAGVMNSRTTDIIWIGDYKTIDTGSIVVENKVKAAESGTKIGVPVGAVGDWVTMVYTTSDEQPEKPVGRDLIPQGWSDTLGKGQGWSSKGTVSGLTGKVSSWSDPVRCFASKQQTVIMPETKEVNVFRMSAGTFKATKFNVKEANAIILNADEAYGLMVGLLQEIDQAPLDSNLKEQLCTDINPQEDQSDPENTDEWYIARNGDRYKMTLKASTTSPKIATLRYVEVTDESGIIVYEGSQTFATDPKVLFDETRVRLTQLLG